jgi:hypothetical protein
MILSDLNILKGYFVNTIVTGEIKIRLVLNHLVVLQNVFGAEVAITLLLYKSR